MKKKKLVSIQKTSQFELLSLGFIGVYGPCWTRYCGYLPELRDNLSACSLATLHFLHVGAPPSRSLSSESLLPYVCVTELMGNRPLYKD